MRAPDPHRPPSAGQLWLCLALLWLAGNGLRITILAVPPVIPLLSADLHMSATAVGILGGLPAVLFACAAIPGSLLIARFGALSTLVIGLLATALGSALRGVVPDVALLYAASDPDVRALVTIAAVARPLGIVERLGSEVIATWRRTGYREEATGRLKRDFLDDLPRHDVLAAARVLHAATLVTHGEADDVVPVADAYALHAALPVPKSLIVTPGCDHRYSDPGHLAALPTSARRAACGWENCSAPR